MTASHDEHGQSGGGDDGRALRAPRRARAWRRRSRTRRWARTIPHGDRAVVGGVVGAIVDVAATIAPGVDRPQGTWPASQPGGCSAPMSPRWAANVLQRRWRSKRGLSGKTRADGPSSPSPRAGLARALGGWQPRAERGACHKLGAGAAAPAAAAEGRRPGGGATRALAAGRISSSSASASSKAARRVARAEQPHPAGPPGEHCAVGRRRHLRAANGDAATAHTELPSAQPPAHGTDPGRPCRERCAVRARGGAVRSVSTQMRSHPVIQLGMNNLSGSLPTMRPAPRSTSARPRPTLSGRRSRRSSTRAACRVAGPTRPRRADCARPCG